jgi:hypothetical protein
MIGNGLKKFANEKDLEIKKGVAYGVYHQYMITLKDGMGYKSLAFAVNFTDETNRMLLKSMLDDKILKKQYRLNGYLITNNLIEINFIDNWGVLKRLEAFLDMFCEVLISYSVRGAGYCSECGLELNETPAQSVLLSGAVFQMHGACIDKAVSAHEEFAEEIQNSGSVFTGTIGATIGAVLGSIPWIIAFYFGWFVGWLGFLIGIASKKGYEVFKGKETKAKGVVIILVVFVTVVFAEFVTYLLIFHFEIAADPELSQMGLSILDLSSVFVISVLEDPAFRNSVLIDIGLGWLFAGLGVYSTLREIFSAAKEIESKPIRLDEVGWL